MFKFLLVAALLPFCMAITPTQCPNGGPMPNSVVVPGCAALPCSITNGGSFVFSMNFDAPRAATTLTNVVNALVLGIDSGYVLPEESRNACASVGCPLSGGENIDFNLSVAVSAPITGVVATLQYQMLNENNEVMVCFRATANIV